MSLLEDVLGDEKHYKPEQYLLSVCKQFFSVLLFGEEIHPVLLCRPAVSKDKHFWMIAIHAPTWCTCSSSFGFTAIHGLIWPNMTCINTQIQRKPANGSWWCSLAPHRKSANGSWGCSLTPHRKPANGSWWCLLAPHTSCVSQWHLYLKRQLLGYQTSYFISGKTL